MLNKIKYLFISLILIGLVSCGGESKKETAQNESAKTVEFNLTGNDQMQFNLKSMVVKAGEKVKIIFKNIGKMPIEQMGHNFVLLKPNVDLATFAGKAATAKENNYIPADETDKIIVHSKLLGPGEETVIEFDAPAQGTYKYFCSFPGHYITMQGNLIVR